MLTFKTNIQRGFCYDMQEATMMMVFVVGGCKNRKGFNVRNKVFFTFVFIFEFEFLIAENRKKHKIYCMEQRIKKECKQVYIHNAKKMF